MSEAGEGPRVEATGSSIVGRVKDAVGTFVHKHLTLEGRTETISAERHYDALLEKMSPEERLRAEPVFAEQARKAAVGTVVRDVAVTAAVLGSAAVGYKYRREIGGAAEKVAKNAWSKVPDRVKVTAARTHESVVKPINAAVLRVDRAMEPISKRIKGATDKLGAFLNAMRDSALRRIPKRTPPATI